MTGVQKKNCKNVVFETFSFYFVELPDIIER